MRRHLALAAIAALAAGCLPFKEDGLYACNPDTGEDCVTCDDASGWCRDITPIAAGATTLYSISGAGSNAVWAGGSNGVIVRWNGKRWAPQGTGTVEAITSVWASSPTDVFAVGSSWTWLHYGGSGWSTFRELTTWYWPPEQTSTSVTVGNFTAVGGFSDGGSGIAWALDAQGMVNFLADANWPVDRPARDAYWALYGVIQDGMVPVEVTAPGVTPSNWINLWGAWADPQLNSYFIGRHGAIVRDTAATTGWADVEVISMPDAAKDDLFAIWGNKDNGNFVAVGETGRVVFFNKGLDTDTWTQASVGGSAVTADLFGVCGTGDTDVFAVGTGGLVLRWNGAAWSSIPQPYQETLVNCYAVGNDLFAVSDEGAILHLKQ